MTDATVREERAYHIAGMDGTGFHIPQHIAGMDELDSTFPIHLQLYASGYVYTYIIPL